MRTNRWTPVAIILAAVACAELSTTEPGPRGAVSLLAPAGGAKFVQNDPSIGCAYHAKRGYGFRLQFDWEDVEGADRYAIFFRKVGAPYAAINHSVALSEFDEAWCNAFVIDANLENWAWRVAAIAGGWDSTAKVDTLWSEERTYGFLPCRHADDAPCTAPPDSIPE